jgi:hypothetical protein
MATWKQVDKETFEKKTEQHTNTYKLEDISLTAYLTDLCRISSGGTDRLPLLKEEEEEALPEFERCITASWRPDEYHFEVFSEEGEHTYRSPARIYIASGEFKQSSLRHFPDKHSDESIFFSFYLPEDWFNWLWNEIGERPNDPVSVRFTTFIWLMGIEAHMYYEVHYNPVRVNDNSVVPITRAKFHIGQRERQSSEPEASSTAEKLEAVLETTDAGIWAKRIFWTLVVIAAILLLKH